MNKTIKLVTYNIDGLPEKLNLKDLPWILKPVAWIYKLIKKSYEVIINDDENKDKYIKQISVYLSKLKPDIIAVQEDFNYHDELTSKLNTNYNQGTYTGGFNVSKLFSSMECLSHFPLPRFKADGLNIFTKKSNIQICSEKIVAWNKSYGYIDHANDILTKKGFRYYNLLLWNKLKLNVYIVHMDADFYHPEKCPDVSKDIEARKFQFLQLSKFILNEVANGNNDPTIIMGDINSAPKYHWDVDNIDINLIHEIEHNTKLHIFEAVPEYFKDVDRIFYINNDDANYSIDIIDCFYDFSANESKLGKISDHKPFVTSLSITTK